MIHRIASTIKSDFIRRKFTIAINLLRLDFNAKFNDLSLNCSPAFGVIA